MPIAPDQIDLPALAEAVAAHLPAAPVRRKSVETFDAAPGQVVLELMNEPADEPLVFRNGVALDAVPAKPGMGQFSLAGKSLTVGDRVRRGDAYKVVYWW